MKLFKIYLDFYRRLKRWKKACYELDKKNKQLISDLSFAKECIKQCSDYADGNPYLEYYIVPEEKLLGIKRVTNEAILRLGE